VQYLGNLGVVDAPFSTAVFAILCGKVCQMSLSGIEWQLPFLLSCTGGPALLLQGQGWL
jgi:hypothetical protein